MTGARRAGRLRVLHVIRSLDPRAGGPPVVCTRLAAAQAARGHAVRIAFEAGEATGGPVEAAPLGRPPASWRRAAAPCREADVVHLHGVWDPILLAAGRAAGRAGVPYLVTPHGMLDPWCLAQRRWKKRLALAVGVRRLLDRAAAVHLLNRDEADLVRPLGLKARPVVVPNGVDLREVDPLPGADEFRAAHPAVAVDPYVLFLGRLHHKKGLDVLADAFARLPARPAARLVVAGADDGGRAAFERRAAALGLGGRVHLVGPLYGRAKWAALAGAAAFCLPSRQEGFSMAVLEALACRLPVVISDACHFPEVAAAGAGLVVPLDPQAVAAALAKVLTDPSAAAAMGTAGRRLVEGGYTWNRVAEACDGVYAAAGVRPPTDWGSAAGR